MFEIEPPNGGALATDYPALLRQLQSLLQGESDFIANSAQFAAFIYQSLPDLNWAGFYLHDGKELVLGPFQGKVACVRIPIGQGVCGAAAASREAIVVPDVHAFAGHIACDSASRSEMVLPVLAQDRLIGVFDLDSPRIGRFSDADRQGMEVLLAQYCRQTHFLFALM